MSLDRVSSLQLHICMLPIAAYLDTTKTMLTLIISQDGPITVSGSLGLQSIAEDYATTRL